LNRAKLNSLVGVAAVRLQCPRRIDRSKCQSKSGVAEETNGYAVGLLQGRIQRHCIVSWSAPLSVRVFLSFYPDKYLRMGKWSVVEGL
jgi:hypothetical protein